MPSVGPQKCTFEPFKRSKEQGILVLNVQQVSQVTGFTTDQPPHVVCFAPGGWGGNHRHESQEVFVGFGDELYLIWRDEAGQRHEAPMTTDDGKLHAWRIPPWVPHMVENRSREHATIYELRETNSGIVKQLGGEDSLRQKL